MGIGVFLVAVLLFSAWQHFELQQHGYKYEQMLQERGEEELVNRHLRLEVETLKAPARVERVATGKLRMVAPTATDSTVIERVAPAPVPPRSVVARR
jgi:cell division protein FtsL